MYFFYPWREKSEVEVDGTVGDVSWQVCQLLDGCQRREGFIHCYLLVIGGLCKFLLDVVGLSIT